VPSSSSEPQTVVPGSSPSGPKVSVVPGPLTLSRKQQKIYKSLTPNELGLYNSLDNNGKIVFLEMAARSRKDEQNRTVGLLRNQVIFVIKTFIKILN